MTPAKLAAILVLFGVLGWYAYQVMQPALPVTVRFQSDTRGSGFALIFANTSDHALSLTATLEHPQPHEAKKFAIQVQPHSTYELGSAQGWVGQSGDRIRLASSNYRAWAGGIP